MINLLVVILPDSLKSEAVIDAWVDAGVGGVTILDSAGLSQGRIHGMVDDMPLIPSLSSLLDRGKVNHFTLFTVIDDDVLLERAIRAAQIKAGGFTTPENGIMFVVPVARAWGLGSM